MAQLCITVPDEVVPRIRQALGHWEFPDPINNPALKVWVPATVQEVQATMKAVLKARVIDYEVGVDAEVNRAMKSAEDWSS